MPWMLIVRGNKEENLVATDATGLPLIFDQSEPGVSWFMENLRAFDYPFESRTQTWMASHRHQICTKVRNLRDAQVFMEVCRQLPCKLTGEALPPDSLLYAEP